jgi:hypothetical protein
LYRDDEQLIGLTEIIDNKIFVHYFYNNANAKSKPFIQKTNISADSIFIYRFNFILSELGNFKQSKVDKIEQHWETVRTTGEELTGNEVYTAYFMEEDTLISNNIKYYLEKDVVTNILFEWEDTYCPQGDLEKVTRETFAVKLNFLETFLNQKLGNPISYNDEEYLSVTWKTSNGLTVELLSRKTFNNIRLKIYKEKEVK